MDQGVEPLGLILASRGEDTCQDRLLSLCNPSVKTSVIDGDSLTDDRIVQEVRSLDLHYIICVRLPFLVPEAILDAPRIGVLNLHPAWLPYNRGWHPATWALLDGTPFGATLHFMNEKIDAGDIVHQKRLVPDPHDTADSLYRRAMELEFEAFREAWPSILNCSPARTPQEITSGTFHRRRDLPASGVQEIVQNEMVRASDFLNKLRGLTTNRVAEAAYIDVDGKRYRVQIRITPEAFTIDDDHELESGLEARALRWVVL